MKLILHEESLIIAWMTIKMWLAKVMKRMQRNPSSNPNRKSK